MIKSNNASIDIQTIQQEPPLGLTIINEDEQNADQKNITYPKEEMKQISIIQPVQQPKAQEAFRSLSNQKGEYTNFRNLACKSSLIYSIDLIQVAVQLFIQICMLGFIATWILKSISEFFFLLSWLLNIRGRVKKAYNLTKCARWVLIFYLIQALVIFVLSVFYPVRYTFDNPEVIDIKSVYDDFYNINTPTYNDEGINPPSEDETVYVKDVYYVLDMCREIYRCGIEEQLEQSSIYYCQKLMNGIIQDNNLQNLNSVQKGLLAFFALSIILTFCLAIFQIKMPNYLLVTKNIPKKIQVVQIQQEVQLFRVNDSLQE